MLAHFGAMTRRERLARACLYLIGDSVALERVLDDALAGGVDVVQMRDKERSRSKLRADALALGARCREAGTLFIVNDDPLFATEVGADGVHLGQDDVSVRIARAIVGQERLVGLSTHSEAQIGRARDVDYIGVGPVWATPTKPGYAPVGLDLVHYAAAHARVPFFAIGGINPANVASVFAAGARGIAVVRAIGEAAEPLTAARALREAAGVVNA
jgi:thiamine-phosphate pyrophosphorylase